MPEWLAVTGVLPMYLGLDLRGGVHFLMEVDTEQAIADRVGGMEQEIKRMLRDPNDRIRYTGVEEPGSGILKFNFANEELRDRGKSKITDAYRDFDIVTGEDTSPFVQLTVTESSVREM